MKPRPTAKLSLPRRVELPRVEGIHLEDLNREYRNSAKPVIIAGGAITWPAYSSWTPQFFKEKFADLEIQPYLSLPEAGAIAFYKDSDHSDKNKGENSDHSRTMPISKFVELMEAGERCYLESEDIQRFKDVESDICFDAFHPTGMIFIKLWIGSKTRSGMHFDPRNNLLAQIFGTKKAFLVSPEFARGVYPFGDEITKSRVDPEMPDLNAYPKFSQATVWEGELQPSDILFIPKGWWHFLHAPSASISVNCWYGAAMTFKEFARTINAAGRLLWLRIAHDFIWHGLLRQGYELRVYGTPPTGKVAYDLLTNKNNMRSGYLMTTQE